MNRTLLLILCDFLLLNLLALTRWEKAEPPRTPATAAAAVAGKSDAASKEGDLVAVMKQSLEDERSQRDRLSQQLQSSQATLQQREQTLSQLEQDRARLSSSLETTQRSAAELGEKFAAASRDASMSKERLAQLQRDLEQRQAEAEKQRLALAEAEKQQAEARQRIESLNVAVKVAEQEKQLLRESAETAKQVAEAERQERLRVQETTTQLAQGVGQLAEKSTELTKEIRDNRPINANTLFNEFLANRVQTSFAFFRTSFLGPINRNKDARTVFVTDGKDTYALLHVDDTPFSLRENGADWEKLQATFVKGSYRADTSAIVFLALDPRIVVLPVTPEQVKAIGAKVYPMALDPLKFPEALLISNGGSGFGEIPFKIDPTNPSLVRMDNRLVRRLFGDFAPSRGDLVLAKTGELLGIMVNSDYCAVVNNFLPAQTFQTGDDVKAQMTGAKVDDLVNRLRRLPLRLQ